MPHISKSGPSVARNEDGHLHVFVFVDHSDTKIPMLLDFPPRSSGVPEFPRIWWAGSVVGDYLVLIHAEVEEQDDLNGMQDFLDDTLWDAGVHCKKATEVAVMNRVGTKHATPDILALVGIKTKPGQTRAVADQLAQIDADHDFTWFSGGSVLTGDLDILLQLNAVYSLVLQAQERLFPLDPDSDVPGLLDGIRQSLWDVPASVRYPWMARGLFLHNLL